MSNILKGIFFRNYFTCLIIVMITISSQLTLAAAEPDSDNTFDLVINLGDLCQVNHQLDTHNLREYAFPFDWNGTPFESMYQFILNDGNDFLERDKIKFVKECSHYVPNLINYVEDLVYHIEIAHDFYNEDIFLKYDEIKEKYDRKVERFFNALSSDKKILFVRRKILYEQAVRLDHLLQIKYPHLNYRILAVDNTEEIKTNWDLERVENFYLEDIVPYEWWGNNQGWHTILSRYKLTHINLE